MISLNGTPIVVEKFLDGTQRIFHFPLEVVQKGENNSILWKYESEEELVTLFYVVGHLRDKFVCPKISLIMPYIPNARMDRTADSSEVFTLKYFCSMINSLKFDRVSVLDPHSHVSEALLDRLVVSDPSSFITAAINSIHEPLLIYFPDDGAMKRYKGLFDESVCMCYGRKVRNGKTGKIEGLEVIDCGNDLSGKSVLMIDDIISYGGTLAYSADELKRRGAAKIYAFATHTENSVLDEERSTLLQRFRNGTVERLYTTNSLITKESEYITIV